MTVTRKKKKKKDGKELIGRKLTPAQELFCQYYAKNDWLFGNATMCYAEAYGYHLDTLSTEAVYEEDEEGTKHKVADSPYDRAHCVCSVNGARLLVNARIDARIVDLLNEMMTDKMVDAEIMRTIKQKRDYGAKLSAIREYNRLKQRVINRIEVNTMAVDEETKNKANEALAKYLNGHTGNSKDQ